ncbi:hypothetical protein [Butyrivibrio sp. FCS014]|uniref:hypothetical protein n=1 Tax=Butyrivibrio sp. FCS014 TaxID=1408304 RepID=UPI0004641EDC|nr:hypothetical protein [Butyrivibrio sp. FCS014]
MEITLIALILSIAGLISALFFVGGIVSLGSLVFDIRLFLKEKSIKTVRPLAISVAGVILPIIMYINTYGFHLPGNDSGVFFVKEIITTNYRQLGFIKDSTGDTETAQGYLQGQPGSDDSFAEGEQDDEMVYVTNTGDVSEDEKPGPDYVKVVVGDGIEENYEESDTIFESLDSIDPKEKLKGGVVSVAPSDDDMPSYGGMPLGISLIAQYFREDDHNCNPVLVLRNETGETYRFECKFTARDEEGNEMSYFDKTVEVVQNGRAFVFEGRFDKNELGGALPDSYEFLITKREPYEEDMADDVKVYTRVVDNSAILTADNLSDRKVKVDAYVLFFDGKELVDCMWMIPQNTDEVCLEPGTMASIRGDAYYRFDRVETFYTAYEAIGE